MLARDRKYPGKTVSATELAKAKNLLVTETLQQREDNDGKALAIERAIATRATRKRSTAMFRSCDGNRCRVQRVMKKYLPRRIGW